MQVRVRSTRTVYAGGYTVSSRPVVELLRQKHHPFNYSNALPPPVVGAAHGVCFGLILTFIENILLCKGTRQKPSSMIDSKIEL